MTPAPILLNVDDHGVARYARGRILTSAGFRVYDAANGQETLALVEKYKPDLILLDVHLPDLDGIEVCRRLKLSQEVSVMVLQISASALSAAHAKAALDAGADAYLMEPVDPDVLVATVRALLRLHQAERSLTRANRQLEILNKELQRSNEDLQQFAFAASHDLQEPLRTMSTFSQLLEREIGDGISEKQRSYFQRISASATRMTALIRDLLAYSQVGREDRVPTDVAIDEAVLAATSNLRQQIEDAGAKLERIPPLPYVWGDLAQLTSVFHNLFSNSIKYRRPGVPPVIRVSAQETGAFEWTICVADNGMGIEPQYQQQVFEPFKRLHGHEIPGTGIGLALCRRIVESQKGRIWAESVLGEGTRVCLTLPRPGSDSRKKRAEEPSS